MAEQSLPALPKAPSFCVQACIPDFGSHCQAVPAQTGCGHAHRLFFRLSSLRNSDSFTNHSHSNWDFYVVYRMRERNQEQ